MKLVEVVWHDAQDDDCTWSTDEEAREFAASTPLEVRSVGFLIQRTDRYVTIGADFVAKDNGWGRITRIPVGMLVGIFER